MHLLPSPFQEIKDSLFEQKEVRVWVKREDFIHPEMGGNKWRKLKYNLSKAREEGKRCLLTFGGAYSNHIYSLASAAHYYGFEAIGIIRGEETLPLNPTLDFARKKGMRLEYLDRSTYRKKDTPEVLASLVSKFGSNSYVVPEGGTNTLALRGCAEIADEVITQMAMMPDYILLPCGTGGTMAGLLVGLKGRSQVLGIAALKGNFLKRNIQELLKEAGKKDYKNWQINNTFHCGGYAAFNETLIHFIRRFQNTFKIPLDPIYTGKLFFGLMELLRQGFFEKGSRILVLHTGGLQGVVGFNQRFPAYRV